MESNLIYSSGTSNYVTTAPLYNSGTVISGGLTLSNQQITMNQQQVKVAVFKVTRNEKGEIASSTFINEFWIEKRAGKSTDFAVAKLLKDKYEADEIVIKEIFSVVL